jgi:hypothetical protein
MGGMSIIPGRFRLVMVSFVDTVTFVRAMDTSFIINDHALAGIMSAQVRGMMRMGGLLIGYPRSRMTRLAAGSWAVTAFAAVALCFQCGLKHGGACRGRVVLHVCH